MPNPFNYSETVALGVGRGAAAAAAAADARTRQQDRSASAAPNRVRDAPARAQQAGRDGLQSQRPSPAARPRAAQPPAPPLAPRGTRLLGCTRMRMQLHAGATEPQTGARA